ncbi:MAG: HAD family phosphatase [Tannerella sp.]|jgi:2-haloacid dehalogenase|nr:HAD family phosphatase [Tannerella sp.]
MIKNIIFDFGNVFIGWNPCNIFRKAYSDEKAEYILKNVYREAWNNSLDRGLTFVENEKKLCAEYPHLSEYIRVFHKHWYESLGEENPESIALLTDLQQEGYRTYGLSNWSSETFPPTRKAHPFFNTFDGILLSSEVKVCKPDPAIYKILLEHYQLQAAESVFIDDRQENLDGATEAGIASILFQTAEQVRQELKNTLSEHNTDKLI